MFTASLKTLVAAQDEQSKHQAILNVAYDDWQKADNWSYSYMLDNAELKYGELAKLAVLVGKYNQQVCNGGHSQYWDNGYASRYTDGFGSNHEEAELHVALMDLLSKHGLRASTKHGEAVYSIMDKFLFATNEDGICYECNGNGGHDHYDDEGEHEYEECFECGGGGGDSSGIGDTAHLDTLYYEINEEWEAELEEFFRSKLALQEKNNG